MLEFVDIVLFLFGRLVLMRAESSINLTRSSCSYTNYSFKGLILNISNSDTSEQIISGDYLAYCSLSGQCEVRDLPVFMVGMGPVVQRSPGPV